MPNTERANIVQHIADALQAGEWDAAVLRQTRKELKDWVQSRSNNLLRDVTHGRLNPDKWHSLSNIPMLTRRYGLMGDDLIFSDIPVEIFINWNKNYTPKSYMGKVEKTIIACRLNPERFGRLAEMYRSHAVGVVS